MCDQQSLRSACAYAQSDQSLCLSLEYSMIVKLLTEHHLELLSFKGGCTSSSESTLVKMPHCWKSHATAQFFAKWVIFHAFFLSADFLQNKFKNLKKFFQEYHQSVQIRPNILSAPICVQTVCKCYHADHTSG